ncbi:MAG TPA: hypothetical protein VFQ39_16660, partial [Longimicrobium sp.]|nr:hypothetical protein [Longimicrobium sp.]
MPLVSCPECGRAISTRAAACPGCGHPAARHVRFTRAAVLMLVLAAGGWTYARYAPGLGWHSGGGVDPAEVSRE